MNARPHILPAASDLEKMPGPSTANLNCNVLEVVNLSRLMSLSRGHPSTMIALIDGPVDTNHIELSNTTVREIPGRLRSTCARADSIACKHGTFVAGILSARKGSEAPSICPDCTLLVRPIFAESALEDGNMPNATPDELATAIIDCVDAGATVVNLSAALAQPSTNVERRLEEALDYSARRGTLIVAAAGNQGTIGSSAITRHPWVIPVVACDLRGRPFGYSNFGSSIGRRGLAVPGDEITSLGPDGRSQTFGGTSAAAPFVTGTIALLQSIFPNASAAVAKFAVTKAHQRRRVTIVPPLLNAWAAYQVMAASHGSG